MPSVFQHTGSSVAHLGDAPPTPPKDRTLRIFSRPRYGKVGSPAAMARPDLCDSVCYEQNHKPIDVYIRNKIPIRI
jgi:hypothetical protein